jgi:hypothetical protein
MRSLCVSLSLLITLVMISPAPAAVASDGWCDSDPILIVRTPAGILAPVFYNVGVNNLLFTPNTLLGALVAAYTVLPTSGGTATLVTVTVTVPPSLLKQSFATRDVISTGAFGSGKVYAYTIGVSGQPMTSTFQLPYP